MKRSTLERDWERLVEVAKKEGFKLNFKGEELLHDFAGMNPEAARAMGYSCESDEIIIDRSLPLKTQCKNLRHELWEAAKMKYGHWKYWPAHLSALRSEKLPLGRSYKVPGTKILV